MCQCLVINYLSHIILPAFLHFFSVPDSVPYRHPQANSDGYWWRELHLSCSILLPSKSTVKTHHSQICSVVYLIKSFQTHSFLSAVIILKAMIPSFRCDHSFSRDLSTLGLFMCWFQLPVIKWKIWRTCSNVEEKDSSDCK